MNGLKAISVSRRAAVLGGFLCACTLGLSTSLGGCVNDRHPVQALGSPQATGAAQSAAGASGAALDAAGRHSAEAGSGAPNSNAAGKPSPSPAASPMNDDAGESPQSNAVDEAAIANSLATAICGALLECVGPALLAQLTGHEDCPGYFGASLAQNDFGGLAASIARGQIVLNRAQLETCYRDTRQLGCQVQTQRLPESCATAIEGRRALGESCRLNAECAGQAFCPVTSACPRVCQPTKPKGQACNRDDECQRGLLCGADHICNAPAAEAAPCAGTSRAVCPLGRSCVGGSDTVAGRCQANATIQIGALGESCDGAAMLCRDGLSCGYGGKSGLECQAAVNKAAACHLALPGQCPLDSYCNAASATAAGTCIDLPKDGQACALGDQCAPAHVCVVQGDKPICRRWLNLGEDCTDHGLCRSGTCSEGRCTVRGSCD